MGSRFVSAEELEYYRGHFREGLREDGVVCLECGGLYKTLGGHVVRHEMTLDDYREKWGYNRQTAFTAAATHERMRRHAVARRIWELPPPGVLQRAREARRPSALSQRRESRLAHSERKQALYAAGWQPRRHRKAEDDALRALVAEGLTTREIAAHTGLTTGNISRRLHALGLVARVPDQRKAADEDLLALRQAGLGRRQIAARLGLAPTSVDRRLRQLHARGVPVPGPSGFRPNAGRRLSDDELLAHQRAGLASREIAARVGATVADVDRRLRALQRRGLLAPVPPPGTAGSPRRADTGYLVMLVREGLRPAEVAARTGMTKANVWGKLRRLRQQGLLPPSSSSTLSQRDRDILELCRAGLWPAEIAARTGLPARVISSRLSKLRRRGLAAPKPAGPRPAPNRRVTDEELLGFVQEGLRPAEMAARVGMGTTSVYNRLRRLRRQGRLAALPPGPSRRGRKRKPYTDEQVLALARGGLRGPQIARQLGISKVTVGRRLRALREQGHLPPPSPPELSERDRRIAELCRAGLWSLEIAVRLGIKPSVVRSRIHKLRRRGADLPAPSRPRPIAKRRITDQQLMGFLREGLAPAEIAARAGMAKQSVATRLSHLRRRGLLPPAPRPAPGGRARFFP